jgi:hypothetical protein
MRRRPSSFLLSLGLSLPHVHAPITELAATAVASPRRSASPRAPLRHPAAPPHLPPPPRRRNWARTPGITAAIAVSPAGTRVRCHRLRCHWTAFGPDDLPCELLVSQGSPWTLFPLVSRAGALFPVGCRRRQWAGRAGSLPSRPGQVGLACGPQAPLASDRGSTWPRCKKFCSIFISRNFRFYYKLVKCIVYSLFIKKICLTYQNAQKNMLYILVSLSCIV